MYISIVNKLFFSTNIHLVWYTCILTIHDRSDFLFESKSTNIYMKYITSPKFDIYRFFTGDNLWKFIYQVTSYIVLHLVKQTT